MVRAKMGKEITITPAHLQSILQRIVPDKNFELISWNCSPLGKSKEESSVYRVFCTLRINNDRSRDYALIVKVLKPDSRRNQVDHYYYWKREALVYDSGILTQLPQDIRAPICYEVEARLDGNVWIWLDDVAIESSKNDWSLVQMCRISYLLGKYSGAYMTGTPLPNESFLCRNWMRSWVEVCTEYARPIEEQKKIWDFHLNKLNDKNYTWELYVKNRTRVNSLLETLELLPRVFAHQDVHSDNIFLEKLNGRDSLIAVDWQFASISGVGEELGRMFGYALLKKKIPVNKAAEYKEELFLSYTQGLRDVGWDGNSKLARFGFTTTASLRFAMVIDKLLSSLEEHNRINEKDRSTHFLSVVQELLKMAEESWAIRSEIL